MKTLLKAIIALAIRLYFGYVFLMSGISKFQSGFNGDSVSGFLKGGLALTRESLLASKGPAAAAHPSVTDTWAWLINHIFLPNAELFAFLVKAGEVLIGIGLILGCFTLLAAFFGMALNFCYLLTGTVSSNPQMVIGFLIILVFGAASYEIGLDRFFMKKLINKFPALKKLKYFFPVKTTTSTPI